MTSEPDWRAGLLAGAERVEVAAAARNPVRWPGYDPRPAVTVWRLSSGAIAAAWDFSVYGGSFGEDDATALVQAARLAVAERRPLLTLVRSGGTRLQEGMAALVGIPRSRLALLDLSAAGLAHLSVADAPTTGGVWISVSAAADVRVAVEGATVGFAGPRVVEAMTGELPGPDSHTAASAYASGLVDAVLAPAQVAAWLDDLVATLQPAAPGTAGPAAAAPQASRHAVATETAARPAASESGRGSVGRQTQPPDDPDDRGERTGWQQVVRSRARTRSGADLIGELVDTPVPLRAPHGDETVAAVLGRLAGMPVVAVAVAAQVGGRPTPDGYRLATRAYRLAARLRLPVLSLVDTPGAEPGAVAERDGIAAAMGEALDALLVCPGPTLALVHGEGGSGGALAAAAADRVLVTADGYFAAIGPEGAQAALRRPAQECADLMRITPADLLALGVADALVDAGETAAHLAEMSQMPEVSRLARRRERWAAPVPGGL